MNSNPKTLAFQSDDDEAWVRATVHLVLRGVVRGEYNVLRAGADPGEIMLRN